MRQRIIILALTVIILIPFMVNLSGWNLYVCINIGKKDLVFGCAEGLSHNALSERLDMNEIVIAFPDYYKPLVNAGPLNILMENRQDMPMTPFGFSVIKPDSFMDYRGFEFPWLLFLLIPASILTAVQLNNRDEEGEEGSSEPTPPTTDS